MNPQTSLSNEQIAAIFRHYHLADNPKISRVNIGFTNEVHRVDDYILKICVRPSFEAKFDNEVGLYRRLEGRAVAPRLVVADSSGKLINKPYMIYKRIAGRSLGVCWHLLTDVQRRQIIKDLCEQLRVISQLEPDPKLPDGQTWQQFCLGEYQNDMDQIRALNLLPADTQRRIADYVSRTKDSLRPQTLALAYWDINLDNIIVNREGEMVGLIDFEHVSVVSLDFVLEIVRQNQRYPWLGLSAEMEKFADKKDYAHLMDWFKEFYPELFEVPELDKRLDFYDLESILRKLPRFPKARQLHERLAGIINQP